MKYVFFAVAAMWTPNLLAADLNYNCSGLWAAPAGVYKAKAQISGSYEPMRNSQALSFELETGAKFSGQFSGQNSNVGIGEIQNEEKNVIQKGLLTRLGAAVGPLGFIYENQDSKLVLSCVQTK